MKCPDCGSEKIEVGDVCETLVGYCSPPGHNHDDNCRKARARCENGHEFAVRYQNRCPAPDCGWRGKTTCFCDTEKKILADEFISV